MQQQQVNREAKSLFAKLLATEDISVRSDPSAHTASFNVDTRVLVLPVLQEMDNDIYDLFVGHEVGHALFTPSLSEEEMLQILMSVHKNLDLAKSALNIVEDARIERLMRNKYPGLGRSFVRGYGKLYRSEFFGKDIDLNIDTYGIMDRINLFYKLGINGLMTIDTTDKEDGFIDRIDAATTFDDVVQIARDLVQEQMNNNEIVFVEGGVSVLVSSNADGEEVGNGDISPLPGGKGENNEGDKNEADIQDSSNESSGGSSSSNGHGSRGNNPRIRDISDVLKHFSPNDNQSPCAYIYNSLPSPILENIVVPWNVIHDELNGWWDTVLKEFATHSKSIIYSSYGNPKKGSAFDIDEVYADFISRNKAASSSMSQSFYRKMAAYTSRHANISKTGRLNMDIIHTYKYNDDLFLSSKMVPKGKNHGMILYMDWSGSMCHDFVKTIEQLLNLVMFCRAIKIPFEVYGFSNNCWNSVYAKNKWNPNNREYWRANGNPVKFEDSEIFDKKGTPVVRLDNLQLLNIFSSKMNSREFVQGVKNILALAYSLSHSIDAYPPNHFNLNGTPLEECIIAGIEVAKKFRESHRVQILNTIFLSDGESGGLRCWTKNNISYYTPRVSLVEHDGRSYVVRDKNYNLSHSQALRMYQNSTGSRVIGFYLVNPRYAGRVADNVNTINREMSKYDNRKYSDVDSEKVLREFRKNRYVEIEYAGYDRYYLMDSSLVGVSVEEIFDGIASSDDTKKIVRDFVKSAGSRSKTRILLNSFAELVAQDV
jgi:hypothetical protein